ncbi:MAG: cell division protein FtsZ, partial [Enterocloster clostridioformis]
SLIEANEAASYVQELAGDEANIIFGAMFDENAQDEATITVIATGLDEHGANASVAKAMTGFTSFKTKVPAAGAPAGQQAHAAAPEAAATASAPYTSRPASQGYTTHGYNPAGGGQGYAAPKYNPNQGYAGGSQNSNPNSATAPSQPFRPATNKEMQINIPDFLKNKR